MRGQSLQWDVRSCCDERGPRMRTLAQSRPVVRVLDALTACGCAPTRSGRGWVARCPAHEDGTPSLGLDEGPDGRALITCRAGCATADVLSCLGLSAADLFEPTPKPIMGTKA